MCWLYLHLLWVFVRWYGVSSSSLGILIFFGYLSDGMGWWYLHILWVFVDGMGWWYHHLLWLYVSWYGVGVSSSSLGIRQMVWGGGIFIFFWYLSNGMGGGIIIFFGYLSDGKGWWYHHLLWAFFRWYGVMLFGYLSDGIGWWY